MAISYADRHPGTEAALGEKASKRLNRSNYIYSIRTPQKQNFVAKLHLFNQPVGREKTSLSLEREVRGSNLGLIKLNTMLPTACHRCDISLKGVVLLGRIDADMDSQIVRYTLWRNTASIMKVWFDLIVLKLCFIKIP